MKTLFAFLVFGFTSMPSLFDFIKWFDFTDESSVMHKPLVGASFCMCDSVSDSLALVDLYNSTNGAGWTNNSNWLVAGQVIDNWHGIQVDGSGCVTYIDLDANNLIGTLPNLNLPQLVFLSLETNDLSGALPSFSNTTSITTIRLSENSYTGAIPNFNIPSVLTLDLSDNQLSGNLPNFSGIPNIEWLILGYNSFSGNLPDFTGMPNLEVLSLLNNNLSGSIPNFCCLPNLETIHLRKNNLTGTIPDFSNFSNLEFLRLGENSLTGPLPDFCCLPSLKYLQLFFNNISGSVPDFNLPELTNLDMGVNNFNGEVVPDFSQMPKLNHLSIRDNNFTGSIPNFSNLPNLISLNIYNNDLTGTIPDFGSCPILSRIFVQNNCLSGNFPDMTSNPIEGIGIFDNDIDSLPDLSSISTWSSTWVHGGLRVENNNLTFDDILPNMSVFNTYASNSSYAPQSTIGNAQTVNLSVGDNYTIDLGIDAAISDNVYTWYKDGSFYSIINGNNKLDFNNLQISDSGDYTCEVTNPGAPALTLTSLAVSLVVTQACPPIGTTTITVTNTNDSGSGSLREAIDCANADPALDNIEFNIPGSAPHIIQVLTDLPSITDDGIIIDATTQPGWSLGDIRLSGELLSDNQVTQEGLFIHSDFVEIYGLYIHNFIKLSIPDTTDTRGIFVLNSLNVKIGDANRPMVVSGNEQGIYATQSDGIEIKNCYVGVDETGMNSEGNVYDGIQLFNVSNATVGGAGTDEGNIVSNNGDDGICFINGGSNNTIYNNLVGVGSDGTTPMGNGDSGIVASDASTVGGSGNQKNIIAFNNWGVTSFFGNQVTISQNSIFCNNFSGIFTLGSTTIPTIDLATETQISGTASPNDLIELFIHDESGCPGEPCQGKTYLGSTSADASGNWALNSPFNTTINLGDEITATATDASNNTSEFSSCAIVVDPCPTSNGGTTITVTNTNDSGIGSLRQAIECANADSALDNIEFNISGSAPHTISLQSPLPEVMDQGISIDGTTQPAYSLGDIVVDGTGLDTVLYLTAGFCSVYGMHFNGFSTHCIVVSADNFQFGDLNKGNIITAPGTNAGSAIECRNTRLNLSFIENRIGIDENGIFDGGDYRGIRIPDMSGGNHTIDNNIIVVNDMGVNVMNQTAGIVTISNNKFGTDETGNTAIHACSVGIQAINTNGIISGNVINASASGMQAGTDCEIFNNNIGVSADGSTLFGPGGNGISVTLFSGTALIGPNNLIANFDYGIRISGPGVSAEITENSIYCNAIDGIFYASPAVGNQEPTITTASTNSISGTSLSNHTIELFLHDETGCFGAPCQGKTYLGTTTADAFGNWTLSSPFNVTINVNDEVTATATDVSNNTSEFSTCATVCPVITANDPNIVTCTTEASNYDLTQHDNTVNGGSGNTVSWYDGDPNNGGTIISTPANIDLNTVADLWAEVSDGGSCTNTVDATVTINQSPSISTNDTPEICEGAIFDLATVNIIESNGTSGTKTYHDASPPNAGNELPSPIVAPLTTTTYYILWTTPQGCTDWIPVTVTVNPPMTATITGPTQVDVGSMITLNGNPTGGSGNYSHSWTILIGNSFATLSPTNTASTNLTGIAAGTVTVEYTVTDHTGCSATHQTTITVVNPCVAFDANLSVIGASTICSGFGATLEFNFSDGAGPYDVTWTGGSLTNIFSGYQESVFPGSTMTYEVFTVMDVNGCDGNPGTTVTITVENTPATPGSIMGDMDVCDGAITAYSINPVAGATTYNWDIPNNGIIQNGGGTTSIDIFWFGAGSGNITVTAENMCGMSSASTFPVTIHSPVATLFATENSGNANNDNIICEGDDVIFTATGGTQYEFFVNAISQGSPSSSNSFITNTLNDGDLVSVIATDAQGCTDETLPGDGAGNEPITIFVNASPGLGGLSISANDVCESEPVLVNINSPFLSNGSYTIDFDLSGANNATGQSATVSISNGFGILDLGTLSNPGITNISITAFTNTENCSESPSSGGNTAFEIFQNPDLSNLNISVPDVCIGDLAWVSLSNGPTSGVYDLEYSLSGANNISNASITVSFSGGNADFPIPAVNLPNPGITSLSIDDLTNGNCPAIGNASITDFEVLESTISISGSTEICNGGSTDIQFVMTGVPPFTFVYSENGNNQPSITTSSNIHTITVSPSQTTTYQIESFSDDQCTGTISGTAIVTINQAPTLSNIQEICAPDNQTYTVSFDINGGDPNSYTVNGNAANSPFTSSPINSGDGYAFNVDDGNLCGPTPISGSFDCGCATNAGTMNNTLLELCEDETASPLFNNNENLDPDDVLNFALHDSPGLSLGQVFSTNTGPDFDFDSNAGMVFGETYYVSSIAGNDDGNGMVDLNDPCLSVAEGSPIIFYENPVVDLGQDQDICPNEFVILNAGNQGMSYAWSTGESTQTIQVEDSGTYTVTVTNVVCTDTDAISVDASDTETPISLCPSDTTIVIDEGQNGIEVFNLSLTVTDNCGIDSIAFELTNATIGIGEDDVSGTFFNTGSTMVLYNAFDVGNNTSACVFFVQIIEDIIPCSFVDSTLLVYLYDSLNGANWSFAATTFWDGNNNLPIPNAGIAWDFNEPINTWHGIGINADGCLTQLILPENNLEGVLPKELGDFTSLEAFYFYGNQLNGAIPTEINNLDTVQIISLSGNEFEGNIPASFGDLKNLVRLALDENMLSGAISDSLLNLQNLLDFEIHNNQFTFTHLLHNLDTLEAIIASNATVPSLHYYDYAPQALIYQEETHFLQVGDTLNIDLVIDDTVTTNSYQWYHDGIPLIPVLDNNQFTIEDVTVDDAGEYWVHVTNPNADSLTLESYVITLVVIDDQCFINQCPADTILNCTEDVNDLAIAGNASSNCPFANIFTEDDTSDLDPCGIGTLIRKFVLEENGVRLDSCIQEITIQDDTPLQVGFPSGYAITIPDCPKLEDFEPQDLPAPFNFPSFLNDDCEDLEVDFSDTFSFDGCDLNIQRTWFVNNLCTGQNTFAIQDISVIGSDTTAPIFTNGCDIPAICILSANCDTTVVLPNFLATDCDGNLQYAITSDFGIGAGPFSDIIPGSYLVEYSAIDFCGNTGTCQSTIEVQDCHSPDPVCIDNLIVELPNFNPASFQIMAQQLDNGSFDNCGGNVQFSFSNNTNDTLLDLDCDDTGSQTMQLWVTDNGGNQAFCEATIEVQDNFPPQIDCPNDTSLLIPYTQMNAIVGNIDAVVSDNCNPELTFNTTGAIVYSGTGQASGNAYNIGTTEVTYTADDGFNSVDCAFDILVEIDSCLNFEIQWNNDSSFCEGGSLILNPGTAESYLWSTGEQTPTITVTDPGMYAVTITNFLNCAISGDILISQHPSFEINQEISICEGESYSIGDSVYTQTGTYINTSIDPFGCDSTYITELTVIDLQTNLGQDDTICLSESIILDATILNCSDCIYSWSDDNTVSDPVRTISPTDDILIIVTVTNSIDCQSVDSIFIEVTSQPAIPDFTGESQVCEGDLEKYGILGYDPNANYQWTLPPGTVYTDNGDHIEVDFSTMSTGEICLSLSNDCGDSDPVCKNIEVRMLPDAVTGIDGELSVCVGASIQYCIDIVDFAEEYIWTYPTGTSTTNQLCQTISWDTPGTFNLSVEAQNDCGLGGVFEITVDVFERPDAQFLDQVLSICKNEPVELIIELTGQAPWNVVYNDGTQQTTISNILQSPHYELVTPSQTTVYSLVNVSDNLCDENLNDVLTILVDQAEQTLLNESICEGASYNFNGVELFDPGNYQDTFQNVSGCDSIILLDLEVEPYLDFSLMDDAYEFPENENPAVFEILENDDVPNAGWFIFLPEDSSMVGNLNILANEKIEYTLRVEDYIGIDSFFYFICQSSCPTNCEIAEVKINFQENCIKKAIKDIPTVFSPGNQDGVNDFFNPLNAFDKHGCPIDPNLVKFVVFNRWGDIVYKSKKYPEQGWDGKVQDGSGSVYPFGVYYYHMSFPFEDRRVEVKKPITLLY